MAKCLGAVSYDPAAVVTKGNAPVALTAFDTTNARIAFTAPSSGRAFVRICVSMHGAATFSQWLFGVLEGATVKGRVAPQAVINGTALATTHVRLNAVFVVPGLTGGASLTWDAAFGCETFVTSSLLKYGGPNDGTANNAYGALQFEIWDA